MDLTPDCTIKLLVISIYYYVGIIIVILVSYLTNRQDLTCFRWKVRIPSNPKF